MSKMFYLLFSLGIYAVCSNADASKTITLNPNETRMFSNNTLWSVNATCDIRCANQSGGKIKIRVLKNKGSINGKNLASGQAAAIKVKNNSSISVNAEAGTQIDLINLGADQLVAVCHL